MGVSQKGEWIHEIGRVTKIGTQAEFVFWIPGKGNQATILYSSEELVPVPIEVLVSCTRGSTKTTIRNVDIDNFFINKTI